MSGTAWERRKAVSDFLRGIWDTKRGGILTWEQAFDEAKLALERRLESDALIVKSMSWEEFQRLQGWRESA